MFPVLNNACSLFILCVECVCGGGGVYAVRLVTSEALWPHGLWPARILCPWDAPGNNTRVGCHFLLQRTFPTQRSNLHFLHLLTWQSDLLPGKPLYIGLPHCRRILYPAEPPEKPRKTGVGSLSLPQGIFPTQESHQGLQHGRRIPYQPSYQGRPRIHSRLYLLILDPVSPLPHSLTPLVTPSLFPRSVNMFLSCYIY